MTVPPESLSSTFFQRGRANTRDVFHIRTGSAAAQIPLLQSGDLDFLIAPAHLSIGQSELANPKAARISFTGSIHSVLQLLKTSDRLAARQHRALRFQSCSNLITDDH